MTLALLLLRHAKSDWTAQYSGDPGRPLNRRGRKAAKLMGRLLGATGHLPDLVFTSPARRATETLRLAQRAGGWSCPIHEREAFYDQGPNEVIQVLRNDVAPSCRLVMAVGHEPAWSATVELLTGATVRFPTGAIAHIELDARSWDTVTAGTGRLTWLIPPRLLSAAGFDGTP